MKRINILSQSVYNRIAAGEVVDRPYSAVKELIENSLDAGATEIEVRIEKGGKQLIKVSDNGSGIYKDDLPSAFLPHATSKISKADDLDNISTLGFRGEALASIAAISNVTITSVTESSPAYEITCEGGVCGDVKPAALPKGTVVTVRDLFYNTPVRAKFMKPDKKEESDITSFVSRFILGNPRVSFKYFADGKLTLQSFGGGLDEAVAQVYGAKVIPQCFKIEAEKDGVKVSGFIGNQNFFKPNKSYQTVFLNGRYIVNSTIATAVSNAYASYAMKRQFPFYVLNIGVGAGEADVNVHPNKADVRFADPRKIFGAVYKIISSVLDGTATAASFVLSSGRLPEMRSYSDSEGEKNRIYAEDGASVPDSLVKKYMPEPFTRSPEDLPPKKPEEPKEEPSDEDKGFNPQRDMPMHQYFGAEEELKKYSPFVLDEGTASVTDSSVGPLPPELETIRRFEEDYEIRMQERIAYETCKFCGTVFNTYLIYEYHNSVFLIDQHAAHERLLYDKLVAKIRSRRNISRQPLLAPYVINLNSEECRFLEKNLGVLSELGFSITPFGIETYRIDEIPSDLKDINVKEFFYDVLADLDSFKEIKLEDILKEKLASTACKHAVKGGKQLTEQEINKLFKMLDGNVGLKCPHGRPICVTLSKRDIEKMFKRIV